MHFVKCINFRNSCSMKYLPVVSTLQEWLDGKLGIQGIDAVSCAFYVLSLLQQNEAEERDTACQLPCSKVVDDHSLSYWPRNSWSNWAYSSVDNSLAAECVSAPVEGYEIGHLGNDLSPSLRSIKDKDGDSRMQECFCGEGCFSLSVTDQTKSSPDDVFSVHDRSNEKCSVAPVTEHRNSFWANEPECVGFLTRMLDGERLKENNSFLMADKMIQEKADDLWRNDSAVIGDKNDFVYHKDKLLWSKEDSGSGFSWNTAEDTSGHIQSSCRQEKHSENIPDMWEYGIFCKRIKGVAPISSPQVGTGIKYIPQTASENEAEDSNLAQLIAKFDHSVEAIWNLDSVRDSPDTTFMQENLPWSFYSIESPPNDASKIEPNEFDNKVDPISEENSFIHSGTNIISSIWSDQPFVNKSSSQSNAGLIFSGKLINGFNNGMDDDQSDLCCKWKVFLTKEELLQNEYNLFDCNFSSSDPQIDSLKSKKNNFSPDDPEQCPNVFCSKIETFPSFFSNINIKEQFCNLENIQDADYGNPKDENPCIANLSPCSISHFNNSDDAVEDSVNNATRNFITLNHNREDSSFTEVLPRQTGGKKLFHDMESSSLNTIKQNTGVTDMSLTEGKINVDGKEEEEDLLTSARTHFRPIQLEIQESHNNPACCYADGTTFIISSNFSEVPYKRSESGMLYLENEDCGTPKKYMEYIDKRTDDQSKCAIVSDDGEENEGAFIPKFCVSQVEKCCQTDDSDSNSNDFNVKKIKPDRANKNWNLDLFSSDDEIVESIENYLEDKSKISLEDNDNTKNFEDSRNDDALYNEKNDSICKSLEAEMYVWNRAGCKCNNNNLFFSKSDSFKAFGGSFASEKGGLWEPTSATRLCQSRYSIWSGSPGPQTDPCPVCETLTQDKMVQHSQLREELSEDGEQLLSDLSSLEPLQLSAGWLDDALEQSGWGTEPNLLTRVSSRRRFVSWGQFGEG